MPDFEMAVIGSGAAGSHAALVAARAGLRCVLIERAQLGGVCLHAGCIPVKNLLIDVASHANASSGNGLGLGEDEEAGLLATWMTRQRRTVAKLTENLYARLNQAGVQIRQGQARFLDRNNLEVEHENGDREQIEFGSALIASGTRPRQLPELDRIPAAGTSDDFVHLTERPRSVLVIGGGHVGCEFASLFSAIGTEVSIIETGDRLLKDLPEEASQLLRRYLEEQGTRIYTGQDVDLTQLNGAEGDGITLRLKDGAEILQAERVLVAIGRIPNTEGLRLEEALGIQPSPYIPVNDYLQTSCPNIYAAGDVTGKLPMAHAAMLQGETAIRNAMGEQRILDYRTMPRCLWTSPEIALCGMMEREAKNHGITTVTGRVPFVDLPRAVALNRVRGFAQLTFSADDLRLLGGLVIGPEAGELISHVSLGLRTGATAHDLANLPMPHPTFSEALGEAARRALGRPALSEN